MLFECKIDDYGQTTNSHKCSLLWQYVWILKSLLIYIAKGWHLLIQRDLSGSSECRRLADNLIGQILDWNQRGWKGNVLNFFVRLTDWQNFEFCNHFWGKIGNGDNFLPILGLRAGLVSVTASRALNRTLCFSNMAINELKNIQWRLCLKLHHTTHC